MTYEDAIKVMQEARVISPALVAYGGKYHAFSRTEHLGSGRTYEEALWNAKLLPREPRSADTATLYINNGCNVTRGNDHICHARSRNLAHRIANALNAYTPNDRGF